MNTKNTTLRQIALMNYSNEEAEIMDKMDVIWCMTMDLKHENILCYSGDIQVENITEACPKKYIDINEFYEYTSENGSKWLVSENVKIADMNEFFNQYLNVNENEIVAA